MRPDDNESDELIENCQKMFGFTVLDAEPIVRGWLNRKWELDTTHGFLDGYRTHREFPTGRILRALRMVWYMESTWWITPNMDQHTVPPQRFAHEMDWLARNMHDLPTLLSQL